MAILNGSTLILKVDDDIVSNPTRTELYQHLGFIIGNNKTSASGTANDTGQTSVLCVYPDDATYWYAYYLGADNDANHDKTYLYRCLKSADILDGTNWVRYGGNTPTEILGAGSSSWNNWQNYLTSIIKVGATYHGYYAASGLGDPGYYEIGHCTSTDLINWTRDSPDNPIIDDAANYPDVGVLYPRVYLVGSTYNMLYGSKPSSTKYELCHATASDPAGPWTIQGRNIASGVHTPSEIWLEDGTYRFYSGETNIAGGSGAPDGTVTGGNLVFDTIKEWSTTDFSTFNNLGTVYTADTRLHEGIWPATAKMSDATSGEDFAMFSIYKHDQQEKIGTTRTEQFQTSGIAITAAPSGFSGTTLVSEKKLVSDVIHEIYPVSGTLSSVINGYSGTRYGVEDNRFSNTCYIDDDEAVTYANYTIPDQKNFGLKTKIRWAAAAATQHNICRIQAKTGEDNNIFNITHNNSKLTVWIYEDDAANNYKQYSTTVDIRNLFPTLANANPSLDFPIDSIDVGFLWEDSVLKVCVGYDANVTVTKDVDTTFSSGNIRNSSTSPLIIGSSKFYDGVGGLSVGAKTDVWPVILLSGDQVTEQNWIDLTL